MMDYAEIICQAVDEIVSKRLESINYDNTITCSVIDITNAALGSYTVSDGSTNFVAYSTSTEYKVNDIVYVTIPNNDFTRQKIIIGKQVTRDTTPFIFTTPFDTIVDVSTNLITSDVGGRNLIANNPDVPPENVSEEDEYAYHQNVKKLVWEKNFYDDNENCSVESLAGFTRLGLQGQFRSWLKSYQTKNGDYGYRLILVCEKDSHENTIASAKRVLKKLGNNLNETTWGEIKTSDGIEWSEEIWKEIEKISYKDVTNAIKEKIKQYLVELIKTGHEKYSLYLSSTDMYGDPYNFQSYYLQEKVFDISTLGKIVSMKLEFYQTPGTFTSSEIAYPNIYDNLTTFLSNSGVDEELWETIQTHVNWPEEYIITYEELSKNTWHEIGKIVSGMKKFLTLIPYEDRLFGTLVPPNLFDKDPYICLGYDVSEFDREQAILYTLDSSTYRSGLTNEEISKQVQLRWLHEFKDGSIKPVSSETDILFETRWYRYKLGHPTVDGYGGVNWKLVNQKEDVKTVLDRLKKDMKNYYLIYHDEDIDEKDYLTQLKVPYKNGTVNEIDGTSTKIILLSQVDKSWLSKRNLIDFENSGFIQSSFHTNAAAIDFSVQSWTNILKSQCIYHNKNYEKTDSFTNVTQKDVDCLHRVGFWELFTMGYVMYQHCPDEYDQLGVSRIWRTGGEENEEWIKNYKNKNLYSDLNIKWEKLSDSSQANELRKILTAFADSFGEWGWHIDNGDNWKDYRPLNQDVYERLYEEVFYLYEKTQNPDHVFNISNFSYDFIPDINEPEEKIKAVILYRESSLKSEEKTPIYSNIITFTNERPVTSVATLDQISALSLYCKDNSYGNYRIYGLDNRLENDDDGQQIRELQCNFDPKELNETAGVLQEADWIMWRIPAQGTMIEVVSSESESLVTKDLEGNPGGKGYFDYSNLNNNKEFKADEFQKVIFQKEVPYTLQGSKEVDGIWSGFLYDKDTDEIVTIWKGNSANGKRINAILEYKIKKRYSPSDTNNTISCMIYKDGVYYETQKEFTFGTAGNSGTDWSFELDFENNETAITVGKNITVNVVAKLYDATGKNVTEDILYDSEIGAKLSWSWHNDSCIITTEKDKGGNYIKEEKVGNYLSLNTIDGKKHKRAIGFKKGKTLPMNSLLYLTCTLENVGDYPLKAILPVPVRKWIEEDPNSGKWKHFSHVTGATFIIYPSSGYPYSYQNPFQVHIIERENGISPLLPKIQQGGTWELFNPQKEPIVYLGKMSDENILKPPAVYTKGVKQYGFQFFLEEPDPKDSEKTIKTCYWTQPIFTMQNEYPSRTLNQWNGKEIKIDHDEGTILAPAIAAGKKEKDNTFSGIMVGSWEGKNAENVITQQTGVYGFDHGAMSYAFKQDGTAFIGKSGYGRIRFDGTKSVIESESYHSGDENGLNGYGMKLDLDDGTIDIKGGKVSGMLQEESSMSETSDSSQSKTERKQYNPTGAHIQLYMTGDPYFRITADNEHRNTRLIDISNDAYYLQTFDFSQKKDEEAGIKFDLFNSTLKAYNFTFESTGTGITGSETEKDKDKLKTHIRMSTEASDYFHIKKDIKNSNGDIVEKYLIRVGRYKPASSDTYKDIFYLQSYNFDTSLTGKETGMKIDLVNGSITAYNFTLEAKGDDDVRIRLSTQSSPYFQISKKTEDKRDKPLIEIGKDSKNKDIFFLQSYNFDTSINKKETGMKINLADGSITAYNFTLEAKGEDDVRIRLSTQKSPYFQISKKDKDKKDKSLIEIGQENKDNEVTNIFFLQSHNFKEDKTGMKIDLDNGSITAYNFTLKSTGESGTSIRLSTQSSPWFEIKNEDSNMSFSNNKFSIAVHEFELSTDKIRLSDTSPYFWIKGTDDNNNNKELIYMEEGSYYLQSIDYVDASSGMKIDLNEGEILAHKFTLSANGLRLSTNDDNSAGYFHIGKKYVNENREEEEQTLIHIGTSSYYLQSANYSSGSSGMKINLADGKIDAYDFTLTANGKDGSILIDSSADSVPLKIGSNFQVTWDGTMTATSAAINSVTLTGVITGTGWNITKDGYATFNSGIDLDGWIFQDSKISNGKNVISLNNGLHLQGDGNLTLAATGDVVVADTLRVVTSINSAKYTGNNAEITSIKCSDLETADDLTVRGTLYLIWDGELMSLKSILNTLESDIHKWHNANDEVGDCNCDSGGGGGESSEPSGPSNNT